MLELIKRLAKKDDGDEEDEDKDDNEAPAEDKEKEEQNNKKNEKSTWSKFWKEFSMNLKMGCYEDDSNRSKLSKLLLFRTTKSEGKDINLDKYLDRMLEGQECIYYMRGKYTLDVMHEAQVFRMFMIMDIEVLTLYC